jgi:tripartite ATP-independent transporter DctM subunit
MSAISLQAFSCAEKVMAKMGTVSVRAPVGVERFLAVAALSVMSLLPITELAARQFELPGIPGSTVFVQHLTLWIAFIGAALAAQSDRLLALSANTFLPEKWLPRVRIFTCAVGGAVAVCLAWASLQFVLTQREAGFILAAGIPRWVAQSGMPVGLLAVAAYLVWNASPFMKWRTVAALGLLVPVALGTIPQATGSATLLAGIAIILIAALFGLPIFATLGGIALLLFWNEGLPVASVPVETYRLVASPILPSLPLFTFAGYLLVEGGASRRLLRVYTALFGWMPGGLAITTVVVLAIFTWAGSGVTILAMGGLLLPMLMKANYPEKFSIGLINASGSLGLLFPPSLPVILYGVYAHTDISKLFIGGFLPGLLMVVLVCAWGVFQGVRQHAGRARFSWAEALSAIWAAKWELAIPALVLVGLFGGFGTLVEAGAVTVLYAFVVECFVYRELSLRRDYGRVAVECTTVVGGVLLIIGVAVGFTNYLVDAQLPAMLIAWTQAHIHSKYTFLLLLNVVLLLKGSFMDVFSAIIVAVPLITPIAATFNIDPVQLGIIFLANLELGYLTPPVGMNLCLAAYRFKQPITSIYRATAPFYLILLLGVLLITYVPWITMAPMDWLGR